MIKRESLGEGWRLLILLLLISFPAVGTVLFTPGLPNIAQFFNVQTGTAQLAVTVYLIGFALGQLPYGPLANRFGRKPSLRGGLILAACGSLLCVLAGSLHCFTLLIIARFIMALGAAAGLKIIFTMIGDVYKPPRSTKIFSYAILAFAITPGVGTAIGGALTQHFGWQSCFYFLALYSLLLLFLLSFMPETRQTGDFQELDLKHISQGYLQTLQNKTLMTCAIILGLRTSFIYVFAAKAPFVALHKIGMGPQKFGLLCLIPPLGMILGTFISVKLADYLKQLKVLGIGLLIALGGTSYMLSAFWLGKYTIPSLFLAMFTIDVGLSLIYANASSMGIESAKNIANGSAIMNFTNLGTSVIMVLLVGFIQPNEANFLPDLFIILLVLMFLFWLHLRKLRPQHS